MQYDLIIIGAGPAGLTASIYAGRAGLKTLVVGDPTESGMCAAADVQNYPGFPDGISGSELTNLFVEQAKNFDVEHKENEAVDLGGEKGNFTIKIDNNEKLNCKYVILATGKAPKKAEIENEEKFKGKGVHYCVACDGFFYKNKNVAVLGNANFAAEEAIELLDYTKNVALISNGISWRISSDLKKILDKGKVKFLDTKIKGVTGDHKFSGLINKDGNELKFDCLFMALGDTNTLSFALKMGLIMEGENLIFDKDGRTNVDGIFAAGNTGAGNSQITRSVGEGTNAAISVIREIKGLPRYIDHAL